MERMWTTRMRWRLRGAYQWPTFAVLALVDTVVMHRLPIAGDGPPRVVPALLVAVFFNLIVVAVAAPLAGRALRRRRRDLPAVVASDYAGTALLIALAVVLVGLGAAHRGTLSAQRAAFAAGMDRVRAYVAHSAPAVYRSRVDEATSLRIGDDLYRTCVPGPDPRRWLCLFVDTSQSPPGLRRDTNGAPNGSYLTAGTRD